jgi:hypothetical protein
MKSESKFIKQGASMTNTNDAYIKVLLVNALKSWQPKGSSK